MFSVWCFNVNTVIILHALSLTPDSNPFKYARNKYWKDQALEMNIHPWHGNSINADFYK